MNDHRAITKIIYNVRKNLPNTLLFYFIYYSYKLLGLLLCTQNLKEYESKSNNITSFYSIFSKLLLFDSSFNIVSFSYQWICLTLFFFLTFFLLFFFISFKTLSSVYSIQKDNKESRLTKFLDKTPIIKSFIKIFTYLLVTISFFSQYLQEYLLFGIISSFIEKNYERDNSIESDKYLTDYFTNDEILNSKIIMIFNIITYFICYFIDFIIIFINDTRGFVSQNGTDIYATNNMKLFFSFSTLFQSLLGCSYLYSEKKRKNVRIIICCIAVFNNTIILWLSNKKFNYYFTSALPIYFLYCVVFSWYSGIIEIILFFYLKEKEQMNQIYSIIKLFLNFTTSFTIVLYIYINNKHYFSFLLSKNLFKLDEKKRNIGEIYYYIYSFCNYRNNPKNLDLYKIIYHHKQHCQLQDCFCLKLTKKLNIQELSNSFNEQEYIIIGEQEIMNRINSLFKLKKFTKEMRNLIILHCQYEFFIAKKEFYALYLCSMYLSSKIKSGFMSKYFLYETKKDILKKIKSRKIISKGLLIKGTVHGEERSLLQNISSMSKFFNFTIFVENVKYLINEIYKNLGGVLSFRKIIKKTSKLNKMNKKSLDNFLHLCDVVKKNDNSIKKTIINYVKKSCINKIQQKEISYLLTNYFMLIHKKIPRKVENLFLVKYYFDSISFELEKDYAEFNLNYPFIISLNKDDNFIVSYVNNSLCLHLNYTTEEAKGKDFSEFLPFEISKAHNLIMKQFMFIPDSRFKNDNTFLLTKQKYLKNISFSCRVLPTLHSIFEVIINIKMIDNGKENSFEYNLLLSHNGHFLNISKEFEETFFFDINQLKQIKITFSDFLGIKPLHRPREKVITQNLHQLEEQNKAYSIFSSIPNEKMFLFHVPKTSYEQLKKKKYHYIGEIIKKDLNIGIQNITKILDEKGLDYEWYNRTNFLKTRFHVSELNSTRKKSMIRGRRSVFQHSEDEPLFILNYIYKEIGDRKYYIMKMTENTNIKVLRKSVLNLQKILTENKKNLILFNQSPSTSKRSLVSKFSSTSSLVSNVPLLKNQSSKNVDNILSVNNSNLNGSLNNSKSLLNIVNNLGINENQKNNNQNTMGQKKQSISNSLSYIKNSKINYQKKEINKTKTKIDLIFKKHYSKLLLISFGVVIALSIILWILKMDKIKVHRNLFNCNIYVEILKTNVYLSTLNSMTLCIQVFYDILGGEYQNYIVQKIKNLKDNTANFNHYIEKVKDNSQVSKLFDLISEMHEYKYLGKDWSIHSRNSTILEEINLLQYLMSQNYYEVNPNCDMDSFYESSFLEFNSSNSPPSLLEQLVFYCMFNTLQTSKNIFETITTTLTDILLNYYRSYFTFILLYGILIVIFTLICYLVIMRKLFNDKNEIKELLFHLFDVYQDNNNHEIFENQVICYRIMIGSFSEENILKFEESKIDDPDFLTMKYFNKKKIHKKKKKGFFQKNLNISNISNNDNNNRKENIGEHHQQKEEVNEDPRDIENKIRLPKSITISYIIVTIFLLLIFLVIFINIIYAFSSRNEFIFSIVIAMNFLERIPKGLELVYYALISIILNNQSFLPGLDVQNIYDGYLNYYKTKININENTQIYYLKDSFYSYIYLEGKMVENNIHIFLGNTKTRTLSQVRKWENKFNENNNICFNSALGSLEKVLSSFSSSNEYFIELNRRVAKCFTTNPGSNEYGILSEIDFIYQELTNKYAEFVSGDRTLDNIINILAQGEITRMSEDFNVVFEYVFESYAYFILHDIQKLYSRNIKIENIINCCLVIVLLFVVIYVFFGIRSGNEKYKKLFHFFYKMY